MGGIEGALTAGSVLAALVGGVLLILREALKGGREDRAIPLTQVGQANIALLASVEGMRAEIADLRQENEDLHGALEAERAARAVERHEYNAKIGQLERRVAGLSGQLREVSSALATLREQHG
ncbi:MAG TPA: hypothetical protein VFJ19_09285 [Nocardioidaceae bacterium]|nr:hypothetical protein [Nocardioidaceae bacterium]